MKRALLIMVCLLLSLILAGSGAMAEGFSTTITPDESPVDSIGIQRGTKLVVGSFTPTNGVFSTEMWGNNTADMDVRALLHAYETVVLTATGGLELNGKVVTDVENVSNSDGSRTATLTIAQDLRYNDGTRITARDYVFQMLLSGAPVIARLGGTPEALSHIAGYEDYAAGKSDVISGVRLLSDYSYSVRIRSDYLPFFYGVAMLSARPMPISEIAPGCEVRDDGQGVYIGTAPDAAQMRGIVSGFTPGQFDAQMLGVTLIDKQRGYVYSPGVTSGPYQLISYDEAKREAIFLINENFKGDYLGRKPHIERLVLRYIPEDKMLDELQRGNVDVLNKLMDPDIVLSARQLSSQGARITLQQYLRTGFAFLAFACESGPTSSVAVRRAIAMSIDKDALIADTLRESALRTYGYYGLGQWMANYADAAGESPLQVQQTLEALDVPMDLDGARRLLEQDGWIYNQDGSAYTDGVRYRKNGNQMEALQIRWAATADNPVTAELRAALTASLPKLGIDLRVSEISFTEVLERYYRLQSRQYNMFFLASNFTYIYDPYYNFHTADTYQGLVNTAGIRDEQLMELARDMRETQPMDMRTYVERFLKFQQRFAQVMPMIPLYSNVYNDVITEEVQGYNITANLGWSYAILDTYIQPLSGPVFPSSAPSMPMSGSLATPPPQQTPPQQTPPPQQTQELPAQPQIDVQFEQNVVLS